MNILNFIERLITRVVSYALITLFFLMLGLAITQVGLRYFFHNSISFADILTRNLVMWVGLLGAVLATQENKHFHIDIMTRYLTERHQIWLRAVTNLFSAVVCYFLGQAATTFLRLDPGGNAFLNVPGAVVGAILPIGFYLMMILFAIRLIGSLIEGFGYHPSSQQVTS